MKSDRKGTDMTIEEAIAHAKEQTEIFSGTHGKFLDVAIAALEKQISKKPQQDEYFKHDYICSCCGKKLAESVDDDCDLEEEMAGWCPYCGQKIDWSEVEEC